MAFGLSVEERAKLEARARAILEACPDVGSFIRRGLSDNPDRRTLVYLRTAVDPAPVVTSAGEFLGLVETARLWLRRNGVGRGDVVAILAPNVTATSIAYWAAMSSAIVQPLNLLFTRDAIAAQLNAVKAKIVFAPPPGSPGALYEKVDGVSALAPSVERIVGCRWTGASPSTARRSRPPPCHRTPNKPVRMRSPRSCRPAARPVFPRSCHSPTATSSPRRSPRCSPSTRGPRTGS